MTFSNTYMRLLCSRFKTDVKKFQFLTDSGYRDGKINDIALIDDKNVKVTGFVSTHANEEVTITGYRLLDASNNVVLEDSLSDSISSNFANGGFIQILVSFSNEEG